MKRRFFAGVIGLIGLTGLLGNQAHCQVKLTVDTLECHIVGFSVGALMPGFGSSTVMSDGKPQPGLAGGNMKDLYSGPYLDFAIDWAYKWQNGWMLSLDADMWFGLTSNNLIDRELRQPDIYTDNGLAMGWGGYDSRITAYNRALALRPGVGKILRIMPKNPDSGILLKLSGGWFMQKTVYYQDFDQSPVPQLHGEYAKLYDHRRNGLLLTESVGFVYMSNLYSYVNIRVTFDVSECVSWSSRPYQIDNLMGLNGKDEAIYFDLLYGLKLTWMFPFTGKTTYDYYYY